MSIGNDTSFVELNLIMIAFSHLSYPGASTITNNLTLPSAGIVVVSLL